MRSRLMLCAALAWMAVTGCGSSHPDHTVASEMTIADQWATATDDGMAAVFGTFTNAGHHDADITGADSPAAARVELHEVVRQANGPGVMRPKAGGITVPAGGRHELAPGGDHLMLMKLGTPLRPGAEVTVTVHFQDGSSLPFTAQVRDFPGADEAYQPGAHDHG